jgi:hypothetical protein
MFKPHKINKNILWRFIFLVLHYILYEMVLHKMYLTTVENYKEKK